MVEIWNKNKKEFPIPILVGTTLEPLFLAIYFAFISLSYWYVGFDANT